MAQAQGKMMTNVGISVVQANVQPCHPENKRFHHIHQRGVGFNSNVEVRVSILLPSDNIVSHCFNFEVKGANRNRLDLFWLSPLC